MADIEDVSTRRRYRGLWAVVCLLLGTGGGLALGFFLWSRQHASAPVKPTPIVTAPKKIAPKKTVTRPEPKPEVSQPTPPPPKKVKSPREEEREWLKSRPAGRPTLAYLFSSRGECLEPLDGSVLGKFTTAGDLALEKSGPVFLADAGAIFLNGARLLSLRAGEEITRRIRDEGVLSVEAVVVPADAAHGGPARIVSLSYDSGKRNFTLGQEGSRWAVRIRTSETGENGTNPEVQCDGLAPPRRSHVVVTYDGETERLYVDGEEIHVSDKVKGDINGWSDGFPLVLGNEAYDKRDWAGVIRFVAFYEKVLTAEEITALAKSLPPGDPPLGEAVPPPPAKPELPIEVPLRVEDDVF